MQKVYQFLAVHALKICIIWLIGWFLIFFPTHFINIDEFHYVGNAYRIVEGRLLDECDGSYPGMFPSGEQCVSKYNIGASFFFLPSVYLGEQAAIFINMTLFLGCVCIFSKLLGLHRLSQIYVYLFAFYPPFIYFSRTAFSEIPAMFLFMLSYLVLISSKSSKSYMLAGLLSGLTILVRYTMALPIAVLVFALFWGSKISEVRSRVIYLALGALPLVIFTAWINASLYGGVLHSGYYLSQEEGLFFDNFIPRLLLYAGALSIMYPGMFVFSMKSKRNKWLALVLPVLVTILFYSASKNFLFEGRVLDLILGLRFLIPVLPLMILGYAHYLEGFSVGRWFRAGAVVVIFMLGVWVPLVAAVHQDFLRATPSAWPQLSEYFEK